MFNLLPQQERNIIGREYKIRLLIVCLNFLGLASLVAFIVLIPSFFLSYQKESVVKNQYKKVASTVDSQTSNNLAGILKSVGKKASLLSAGTTQHYMYELVDHIIKHRIAGIRIEGVSIGKDKEGKKNITVQGNAKDRDTLSTFSKVLKGDDLFSDVTVPVSNFAPSYDLNFSIVIKVK